MSFSFVSGDAALDLAGTVQWRRTGPRELLAGPSEVCRWLDESGVLPGGAPVSAADFARTISLREAVYRLVVDRLGGAGFDQPSLDIVNEHAGAPGLGLLLLDTGAVRRGGVSGALAELARSAVRVLADPDLPLRECASPDCTRIYLDRSRGARRSWCGMRECGNREKAAAYRARKRTG